MGEILTDITFERWVKYIFDHPAVEGQSYWHTDWDTKDAYWDESKSPAITVSFMTQLFENAGEILAPYSNAQLSQSFWYVDNEIEGYMYTLHNLAVPLTNRLRCIQSIYNLFEQVFAVRCSPEHINDEINTQPPPPKNPLNTLCFMWWDISPIYGRNKTDDERHITQAAFEVMQQTLQLNSTACQASALHGLGHADLHYSATRKTIDAWLLTHEDTISDRLKTYALAARDGNVL